MPTQNPRINVILDNSLYKSIQMLAKKDNVALSTKVRDLIKEALEIQEDIALSKIAEEREISWDDLSVLDHNEIWD